MKVVSIMKRAILILVILFVFLMSACTGKELEYFASKEEALDSFVEEEEIDSNLDLIVTTKGEHLLVAQSKEDVFFVGELIEAKDGSYDARRISDSVVVGIGASWELDTKKKNKYTIYFEEDENELNYLPFSNGEYSIALSEGHTITKNTMEFTNAIKELSVIQD